jgi:hypothetical protein
MNPEASNKWAAKKALDIKHFLLNIRLVHLYLSPAEDMVDYYRNIWHHILGYSTLHSHGCERFHIVHTATYRSLLRMLEYRIILSAVISVAVERVTNRQSSGH